MSLGSPAYRSTESGGFLLTDVWFAPRTVIPHHTHARPVLGVMLEGGFDDAFSRRTIEATEGMMFTEPGEEGHSNRIGERGARVLAIQPDPDDVELWDVTRRVLDEIRAERHAGVAACARRLARELRSPDALSGLAIEALALDMLVTIGRLEAPRAEPPWLARVDEIVRDGFRGTLRVADIAAEVGVHRAHLSRVYRERRGVPIGEHIRGLRLEWAAERLAGSDDDISSIATCAGFADQSHLTRSFRRRYGLPPRRYREVFRG